MAARRGALILAAGASQRMGTPKALLAWGDTTLLDSVLREARTAAVQEIVVVLGPSTQHLADTLSSAQVVINPDPETGRSASIRLGSEALSEDLQAIVVQSVDQPCPADVLNALFAAIAHADVALPIYRERRGHPICLAGRLVPELRQVTEADEGLRAIVRRHAEHVVQVPVDSESVTWNLNDPAAYAAARASAGFGAA